MACLLPGRDRPGPARTSRLAIEASARPDGQVWALHLVGDLDVTSQDQLRAAIRGALDHGPRVLLLDLSALDYADCGGLSVMVSAHQALARQRRQLQVTGAHGTVRRLMQVTGIDQVLRADRPAPGCVRSDAG